MPFRRPPILVTLLGLGVLFFSIIHFMGLAAGFRLPELPLVIPVWYLWIKHAVWGICGAVAAVGLLSGRSWSPRLARWSVMIYIVWYWFDRLLLVRSDFARQSWPTTLAITVLVTGCIFWILSRRSVRGYFRERTL